MKTRFRELPMSVQLGFGLNCSRRVTFPFCFHASPANVCCLPTLVSTDLRYPSIDENRLFHSITEGLCRGSLRARPAGANCGRRAATGLEDYRR